MKPVPFVSIVSALALLASTAWADCTRPKASFEVPQGNTASAEQMAVAQRNVVDFTESVAEYVRCLQGEFGQKSIGKSEAEKTALQQSYAKAHQEAADEATGFVDCFNEQLDSFKASGGGTQMQPADCSAHIKAAAQRSASAAPSVEQLVIEASGHRFEVPSGTWTYLLARDDNPRPCGEGGTSQCLYRAVVVINESDETLECKGQISYDGTDIRGNPKTTSPALVSQRSTAIVTGSLAKDDISASIFDAVCKPRAKLPPLDTPAHCKYEVVKPIAIADYYPAASREAGEQGPVTVEFTLPGKAANPTQVRAVASSLFPALDEAAVKAVSDMVMSSNCPNAKYRLRVSFRLE